MAQLVRRLSIPLSELLRICDSSNVAQEVRGRKKEMMFKRKLELLVVRGMMSGRRFPMSANGSRLGRAGTCEIAINGPILSRHHCLFEYVANLLHFVFVPLCRRKNLIRRQ